MRQRLRSIAHSGAQLPGGKRTKFAVVAIWLVMVMAIGPLAGKFEDARVNDPADLPANVKSVKIRAGYLDARLATADTTRSSQRALFEAERPLSPVQWSAILGSIAVLVWSVLGLIVNPDSSIGDSATAERVLGVDMNGWHALSGFLVAIPGFFAALRASWSGLFVVAAAGALIVTGVWALFDTEVAVGFFYFPNQEADAVLHFRTSAIFIAGAAHYFLVERAPPR
jgi:hypothetical protein